MSKENEEKGSFLGAFSGLIAIIFFIIVVVGIGGTLSHTLDESEKSKQKPAAVSVDLVENVTIDEHLFLLISVASVSRDDIRATTLIHHPECHCQKPSIAEKPYEQDQE